MLSGIGQTWGGRHDISVSQALARLLLHAVRRLEAAFGTLCLAYPGLADKSRRDEQVYCITKTVVRVRTAG
jgi:hypothetical protein